METFFFVLVLIAMFVTLGVLATGIIGMARGGEFNAKYGNKLMRARVIAQGIALALFAIAVLVGTQDRSDEHTSELQSLMRISYAVFCLTKKNNNNTPPKV